MVKIIKTYKTIQPNQLSVSQKNKYGFNKITKIPGDLNINNFLLNGSRLTYCDMEYSLSSLYYYTIKDNELYIKLQDNKLTSQLTFANLSNIVELDKGDQQVNTVIICKYSCQQDIQLFDEDNLLVYPINSGPAYSIYLVEGRTKVSNPGISKIIFIDGLLGQYGGDSDGVSLAPELNY